MDKTFIIFFILGLTTIAAQRPRPDAQKICRGEFDCRDPEECVKGVCVRLPNSCRWPGVPAFGSLNPDWQQYELGTQVFFSCQRGYKLVGNPRSTCTNEGLWSTPAPKCVAQKCSHPGRPYRGLIVPDKNFYLLGETVRISCKSFYRVTGPTSTTCRENGTWSNELPKCEKPTE